MTTAAIVHPPPPGPPPGPPPMWDSASHRWDAQRLVGAIVRRGWTRRSFARAAKLSLSTVYKACRGERVSDDVTTTIYETLEKREPMEPR